MSRRSNSSFKSTSRKSIQTDTTYLQEELIWGKDYRKTAASAPKKQVKQKPSPVNLSLQICRAIQRRRICKGDNLPRRNSPTTLLQQTQSTKISSICQKPSPNTCGYCGTKKCESKSKTIENAKTRRQAKCAAEISKQQQYSPQGVYSVRVKTPSTYLMQEEKTLRRKYESAPALNKCANKKKRKGKCARKKESSPMICSTTVCRRCPQKVDKCENFFTSNTTVAIKDRKSKKKICHSAKSSSANVTNASRLSSRSKITSSCDGNPFKSSSFLQRNILSQSQYMDMLSQPQSTTKNMCCQKMKKCHKKCAMEPCPPRLAQLAAPRKQLVLANWKMYENVLPAEALIRFNDMLENHGETNLDLRDAREYFKKLDLAKKLEVHKARQKKKKRRKIKNACQLMWFYEQIEITADAIVNYIFEENVNFMSYSQMQMSDEIMRRLNEKKIVNIKSRCGKCTFAKTILEICDKIANWTDKLSKFVDIQPLDSRELLGQPSAESLLEDYETDSEEGEEQGEEYEDEEEEEGDLYLQEQENLDLILGFESAFGQMINEDTEDEEETDDDGYNSPVIEEIHHE